MGVAVLACAILIECNLIFAGRSKLPRLGLTIRVSYNRSVLPPPR